MICLPYSPLKHLSSLLSLSLLLLSLLLSPRVTYAEVEPQVEPQAETEAELELGPAPEIAPEPSAEQLKEESATHKQADTTEARRPKILDSKVPMALILKDGSRLQGIISCQDDDCSLFVDDNTTLVLSRSEIKNIKKIEKKPNDPNRSRYLYSQSGFSLNKGEAYISQKEIYLSVFAYGITDSLTITVGSVLPIALLGLYNVIPGLKYSFEMSDTFRAFVGIDSFLATYPIFIFNNNINLNAGVTFGTQRAHLTLGVIKPYITGVLSELISANIFTLSGNLELSKSFRLISESWFIITDVFDEYSNLNLYSLALRIQGDQFACDLGFVKLGLDTDVMTSTLPWLDLSFNF